MQPPVRIELHPAGRTLELPPGSPLQEALFNEGVEFPCGGHGRCRGCRIRITHGTSNPTPADQQALHPADLAKGWRLACQTRVHHDLGIELAQWEADILTDHAGFHFSPKPGLGIAIDLGTTTLVAQLIDRTHGTVLGVRTALNPQAAHGADIMSRISFALNGGQTILTRLIRSQLEGMTRDLLTTAPAKPDLQDIVIVGNTVMHHLFCNHSLEPLAHVPFEPAQPGPQSFPASALDWSLPGNPQVHFLPCLGGFVGSDLLAGLLATRIHESADLQALVDLGTNGELIVGNRDRILCASTAAGPAFEGARISMGMRAVTGAIAGISSTHGTLSCRVLGGGTARGLCGSGLVDAVAAGLDLNQIQPSGRFTTGTEFALTPTVLLKQADIRELQLAKGAIAAGLRILLEQWGASPENLTQLHLAGAFGNYLNLASAQRIGLLPASIPIQRVIPSGNTALLGAKHALFHRPDPEYADLRNRVTHVSLNEDLRFQEIFVEEMGFPSASETASDTGSDFTTASS